MSKTDRKRKLEEREYPWYNHDTKKFDYHGLPQSDEEALPYVPITAGNVARKLYRQYREAEMSIFDALFLTMPQVQGEESC